LLFLKLVGIVAAKAILVVPSGGMQYLQSSDRFTIEAI